MATSAPQMDQEVAQVLFREGATLVFLDVPEGTEFGIDFNSWVVGPRFKGVKMIPPGIHFVYYSAVSKEKTIGPRTGFFHNFQHREVLVKKWDPHTEDISSDPIKTEEQERLTNSKEELDPFLGVYPYDSYKKWISMTNHLSPELLCRLQPLSGKITSVTALQSVGGNTQQRQTAAAAAAAAAQGDKTDGGDRTQRCEESYLPHMDVMPGTEIRFTPIPKQKYPDGASPAEITKYNMDHSYVLQTMLSSTYKDSAVGILGELQFAFVCFVVGQVYDAFEQWKQLIHLLCSCDEALTNQVQLYNQFIGVMHYQLQEIPEDFFVDIVSSNNFLTTTLHVLFTNIEASSTEERLRTRVLRFRDHLQKKFGWDFTSEPDEDAPVIVE